MIRHAGHCPSWYPVGRGWVCSAQRSPRLQRLSSPLEGGLVGLAVDPHRVQPLVTKPGRHGGQVDRLDQAPARVVAKPMRVDTGYVRASAELGEQVLDAACRVRPAFAAEDGAAGPLGQLRLNRPERLARLAIERQATMFVALADDVDPARAGLQTDALPAERD